MTYVDNINLYTNEYYESLIFYHQISIEELIRLKSYYQEKINSLITLMNYNSSISTKTVLYYENHYILVQELIKIKQKNQDIISIIELEELKNKMNKAKMVYNAFDDFYQKKENNQELICAFNVCKYFVLFLIADFEYVNGHNLFVAKTKCEIAKITYLHNNKYDKTYHYESHL